MIEYVILIFCIVNLFFLLGLCNEVLDIRDYIFYKEVMKDESNLRDN